MPNSMVRSECVPVSPPPLLPVVPVAAVPPRTEPLDPMALAVEHMIVMMGRVEAGMNLVVKAVTPQPPPPRLDPDPPDVPPFYTATQPLYPPYQPLLLPYKPNRYLPLTPYTYATSLLPQTHQLPPPPTNSIGPLSENL